MIALFAATDCTDSGSRVCLSPLPHVSAGASRLQVFLSVGIGIIAAICLLFLVIGGMRYVLSDGDPQRVSRAKGTVLYALIGLVITILAQTLVWFVVGGVTG